MLEVTTEHQTAPLTPKEKIKDLLPAIIERINKGRQYGPDMYGHIDDIYEQQNPRLHELQAQSQELNQNIRGLDTKFNVMRAIMGGI